MGKLIDLAKAEISKKDDQKALEALQVAVDQAAITAQQHIFNMNLDVKKAEAAYNNILKSVGSSLLDIVNAKLAFEEAKATLEAMEAVQTERF